MKPFPNKQYNVIYADPAWSYKNKNTGGSFKSGSNAKYETMSIENICNLPVEDISAKNCVLFLWGTVPLLPDAFKVMEAWSFKYKTMITWRKIMSLGMGFWFRGQCEHLLFGVKGNVKAFRLQESNFIQCKALRHSEKPPEFRALIERATKNMEQKNKIELFARETFDGWDAWGNEI